MSAIGHAAYTRSDGLYVRGFEKPAACQQHAWKEILSPLAARTHFRKSILHEG
jgi:hypothetical protein